MFFQIRLFFISIFLLINTLIILQFLVDNNAYKILEMKRYISTIKTLEELHRKPDVSNDEINERIAVFDMKLADISFEELLKSDYKKIKIDKDAPIDIYILNDVKYVHFNPNEDFRKIPPPPILPLQNQRLDEFGESIFFKLRPKPFEILLIDELNEKDFKYFWLVVLFSIDVLLLWFFMFIEKKLKPLISLKKDMKNLSNGNLQISTKTDGKDEISQVAKEFDIALKQLKELRDSRNLFLRNIMHEFKTPITKGRLITDIYEDSERKFILIRVFQRLEYLLSEFAKIEELTSGKITLDKRKYYVVDLIEQAFDILLLEEDVIEVEYSHELKIEVDFELFSIALKNLIDNAIKYKTEQKPKIIINEDSIQIINKGKELSKDIKEYFKPFNHDYETATSGLGLGLYISNNIIKIHKFELNYIYEDGYHNFFIKII
ncbi:ArsS family sensor histidine kinase [Aliarcobacter butzleri]|uniref:ArsS family sensor histidine kinase n=1 Tax=Aliarcobacter butzleri TaxID=28197 RepID=UPI0021B320C6|nr:ArsS family sensor histidine kinase [Aliarcobacter butzleri]MCT7618845.1 ArsS family sensor histidine kinase [Aliarcobacter butzleri]MDN5081179.1 ArsS family sensor histidine kinase [Aliarcobacter butzleri]MDN5083339.1 ArsS family sensor histidine kinase [Aliarcobacter butzleri]MDN5085499.1 ArsS family sensor histidine kinase [Aliarcobacter butzleri]